MGRENTGLDRATSDLYQEYRYHLMFGGAPPYDEQSAHKSDWWAQFESMDDQVQAALRKREADKPK